MKGHYLSGKGKMIAAVATLCVGVGFTAVPLASAYPIPIEPGSRGTTDQTAGPLDHQ